MVKPLLLGGEWLATQRELIVRSPEDSRELAAVSLAGPDENAAAISAAAAAARELRVLPRYAVAEGLRRMTAGIEARKDEFADTIVGESAKPIRYARAEVERAIATFSFAAGEAERFVGDVVPVDAQSAGKGRTAWSMNVPRGVIYGITPFNFPLNLVAHKVAPALASGNAIVIKPSDRTPLTALLLGEIFMESGLPAAALQIVPTPVAEVESILADERVSMLSFTGSAPVGWDLKRKAGKKAVALELGGNASVIVDESADVETSVQRSLVGAFAYSGQVCISVQRIFVHDSIFEAWTESFVSGATTLRRGRADDEMTDIGVMIDEAAAKRTEQWVGEAVGGGARLMCGGPREGAFMPATVLTNTDPEMRVVAEEVFGPVVAVERVADLPDAIAQANLGKYGLQAGVFSRDIGNIMYAAKNLEYGGIIINDVPTFRVDNMPYGGMKDSGFGREGVRYAMLEMCETRLVVIGQ
jgi:glyceraldehyde-3-phosphate dehydrogenase (NADP+)